MIHGKPSTEIKSRQYVDRLLGESRTRKLLYIAQVRKRYFISPYCAILRITYSRSLMRISQVCADIWERSAVAQVILAEVSNRPTTFVLNVRRVAGHYILEPFRYPKFRGTLISYLPFLGKNKDYLYVLRALLRGLISRLNLGILNTSLQDCGNMIRNNSLLVSRNTIRLTNWLLRLESDTTNPWFRTFSKSTWHVTPLIKWKGVILCSSTNLDFEQSIHYMMQA